MSDSKIQDFYSGQNVFITGGNGFIGKILVEKLLRSTDVATIYLLMRKKKGKDVDSRLEEMLENEPFKSLKETQPTFQKRLKIIVGDNLSKNLELSVSNKEILRTKINIVFHVAATIRFHENIKVAYETNVGMTKKIIDLCCHMKNLKSFIYVSTAYSNCYEKSIDEIFYENFNFDYRKIDVILNEPHGAEELTKTVLKKWPNTYSFTKAVAELLIKDFGSTLPVGIFRPSIVISTYKEPIEGWTDSLGGPNILVATIASGFLRYFCCDINYVVDLVPVDLTVSALIASAWDVYQNNTKRSNIPIYNFVSSVDNPITYDEFIRLNVAVHNQRFPFHNCLWAPKMIITKQSKLVNVLLNTTYHYIPALLLDLASILCLKKPTMVAKYRKFNVSRYHMEYFMAHEWKFTNNNVKNIWNQMTDRDKKIFPFDVKAINWLSYLRSYFKGIRFYLFKEPWSNLEKAKTKARRLEILHNVFLFVTYFIGFTTIWTVVLRKIFLHFLSFLKRISNKF